MRRDGAPGRPSRGGRRSVPARSGLSTGCRSALLRAPMLIRSLRLLGWRRRFRRGSRGRCGRGRTIGGARSAGAGPAASWAAASDRHRRRTDLSRCGRDEHRRGLGVGEASGLARVGPSRRVRFASVVTIIRCTMSGEQIPPDAGPADPQAITHSPRASSLARPTTRRRHNTLDSPTARTLQAGATAARIRRRSKQGLGHPLQDRLRQAPGPAAVPPETTGSERSRTASRNAASWRTRGSSSGAGPERSTGCPGPASPSTSR